MRLLNGGAQFHSKRLLIIFLRIFFSHVARYVPRERNSISEVHLIYGSAMWKLISRIGK